MWPELTVSRQVICDYTPEDDRMLPVRVGEVLTVHGEDQEWLICSNEAGRTGFVSPYYVSESQKH